ncbi:MAG: DUF4870 domain-containing protein [Armatimonadota bacterium]
MYSQDLAVNQEEKTLAMLAHLLGIFTGFIGPLILYVVRRDSRFIAFHALQSVLFQLGLIVALFVSALLVLVLIGMVLFPAVAIGGLIYAVIAAVKSYQGEWFSYWLVGPIARRTVEG